MLFPLSTSSPDPRHPKCEHKIIIMSFNIVIPLTGSKTDPCDTETCFQGQSSAGDYCLYERADPAKFL